MAAAPAQQGLEQRAADTATAVFRAQAHELDAQRRCAAAELAAGEPAEQVADELIALHGRELCVQQRLLLRAAQPALDVVAPRAPFDGGVDRDDRVEVGRLQGADLDGGGSNGRRGHGGRLRRLEGWAGQGRPTLRRRPSR